MLEYKNLRPLIFKTNPETAHNIIEFACKYAPKIPALLPTLAKYYCIKDSILSQDIDGMQFYNPVGFVSIGKNTKVWLRVKIDCLKLQFSYSLDGENFENIGGELDCSNLADEAYVDIGHEGHTGTFVGISCQDLTGGNGGEVAYADFEYFNYKTK